MAFLRNFLKRLLAKITAKKVLRHNRRRRLYKASTEKHSKTNLIYLFNIDHQDSIKEKESGNDICLNKISGNRKITILKNKYQPFYYFILKIQALIQLPHFQPMFHFYTSRNIRKQEVFWRFLFSGVIQAENRLKMG